MIEVNEMATPAGGSGYCFAGPLRLLSGCKLRDYPEVVRVVLYAGALQHQLG